MRRRLLTIGAASLVALSAVVGLAAQRPSGPRGPQPGTDGQVQERGPQAGADARGPRGRGPGGPGGPAGARLDLTDEQQNAIAAIVQRSRDESAPIADELQLARHTLHRELFADKRDTGRLGTLTTRVAALEKQLLDAQVKSRTAIADLLTPEQRLRARTDMVWFGGPGAGRPGMGRGVGRGPRPGSGAGRAGAAD